MRLFDLSLRFKMPLWGGGLIFATALALSTSFAVQAWENLHHDLLKNAEDLGRVTAHTLFPALLHDDMYRAFEVVSSPFAAHPEAASTSTLIVLDDANRVYVSSNPEEQPVLKKLRSLGPDFAALDEELPLAPDARVFTRDAHLSQQVFVAVPIANDGVRLGTLIVAYDKSLLRERFAVLLKSAWWITLLVLGVLLPVTAYWGQRMMKPMRLVTERIGRIGSGELTPLDPAMYPYRDEVGLLFRAYDEMLSKLREKAEFEKEMVKSERMAAVGRLTASIAHEINNPLGGMLNAISTLKRHGSPDPVTQRTVSLLERGLTQIRETVAALLVEAKVRNRPLTAADFEDIRILVTPAANKQRTQLAWSVDLPPAVSLPSTVLRQVLINLLLNAITAAGQDGRVEVRALVDGNRFVLAVENDGKSLLPDAAEPFVRTVHEVFRAGPRPRPVDLLHDRDAAGRDDQRRIRIAGVTRFTVIIPLDLPMTKAPQDLPD